MAKANPLAWFPSARGRAHISLKKVNAWAQRHVKHEPFFDTWHEAHQWLYYRAVERVEKAKKDLVRAQNEIKNSERHLAKVTNLNQDD